MSYADEIQLGVPRDARLDALLADLRSLAERHGWLFRRQAHAGDLVPSIEKYKGERLWFVWEKDRSPKDIDKISMALAALELKQTPMKFLDIDLHNPLFGSPFWWSSDRGERTQARAFAASFLTFLEDVIRLASLTHGLGERDDLFTQEQLNTTILPPPEELVATILRNARPPWVAYFGPELAEKQGEQIRRLGAAETRELSGGILAVFRTNPSSIHDMSPEELRKFRQEVEPVLEAELKKRREAESARPRDRDGVECEQRCRRIRRYQFNGMARQLQYRVKRAEVDGLISRTQCVNSPDGS